MHGPHNIKNTLG